MKKIYTLGLLTFVGIFCASISFAQSSAHFIKIYGGSKVDSGRDIVVCPDSGYIAVGNTSSFGAGDSDIYVMRMNKFGDTLWSKTYGGAGEELAHSIIGGTDGNYFIAGSTTSSGMGNDDFWLLKIDPNGGLIWSKTYGSFGRDYAREVHQTSDGGLVMVGTSNAAGPSQFDAMMVKTNASGDEEWTKRFGGSSFESGYSVKQTGDGGYILLGQTFSYGNGGDVYMVKTDGSGNLQWQKNFGGFEEEEGQYIQLTSDGGYIFTADAQSNSHGDFDVWIVKTNSSGVMDWEKMYGTTEKDVVKTIHPTNDGGYIVGAITRGFSLANPDFWIIKTNSSGDSTWSKRFGGSDHEHTYSVKQALDGGYIAVGHTRTSNLEDFYIVKMDGTGNAVGFGDQALSSNSIQTYPNPSTGLFNVRLNEYYGESRVVIYDITGRQVFSDKFNDSEFSITTKEWPSGIYYLNITADKQYAGKISVQ